MSSFREVRHFKTTIILLIFPCTYTINVLSNWKLIRCWVSSEKIPECNLFSWVTRGKRLLNVTFFSCYFIVERRRDWSFRLTRRDHFQRRATNVVDFSIPTAVVFVVVVRFSFVLTSGRSENSTTRRGSDFSRDVLFRFACYSASRDHQRDNRRGSWYRIKRNK